MSKKRGGIQFFKTTIIGGLIFLVPIIIVVAILGKAYELMIMVAKPLSAWIPLDAIGGVALANILADTFLHLARRLVGERDGEDAAGRGPLFEQVGDACGDHARLP